ncbi:putative orfan [Tupanvirus soda lake]|uniref:Orfan n=2 Tax=Tupanvirus TaxID=2094720 RepID=A0AC62ABJ4_9VIRU|nr:putative orfan [Tupanvirus soda lake]QKU35114.1 putative orfan [Tupanvirus soda lake]
MSVKNPEWNLKIGDPIIISQIGKKINVEGIPVQKYNDGYVVKISDPDYKSPEPLLQNSEKYKKGFYLLRNTDKWTVKETGMIPGLKHKQSGTRSNLLETVITPTTTLSPDKPQTTLLDVAKEKKTEESHQITTTSQTGDQSIVTKNITQKTTTNPNIIDKEETETGPLKIINTKKSNEPTKKSLVTYELPKEIKHYKRPRSYDITPTTVKYDNTPLQTSSHKQSFNPTFEPFPELGDRSEKVEVVELENTFGVRKNIEKGGKNDEHETEHIYSFGKHNKEKEHKFAKVDVYNPKYLEMLDHNTNKYALVFKNLDLYSDIEVDAVLDRMAEDRLLELLKIGGEPPLIREVTECMPVLDPKNPKKEAKICKTFISPIYDFRNKIKLLRKLEPRLRKAKHLSRAKHEIVVNNLHIIEDELITKEEYEISEGGKIMAWIENNLVYYGGYNTEFFNYMMFADLITYQHKGHIYIAKAGIRKANFVTEEMLPNLKYLRYQYNNPINIAQLIVQMQASSSEIPGRPIPGATSSMRQVFEEIKDEASQIMALEYFICLQPQPRYMLYTLKRLVVAWYSDFDLIDTVTKIRLLINQYRARRDKKENLEWGVLPSIVIYLRYGAVNFSRALSKINYYFTNYIHTGWFGNEPDYFTKYNDLIYYSNGSPDAKRFFEHLPITKKMEIYKPYTINPTAFLKYGEDIVTPYPQIYTKKLSLEYRSKFDLEKIQREKSNVPTTEDLERQQDRANEIRAMIQKNKQ